MGIGKHGLTPKQLMFCNEYARTLNATQSYQKVYKTTTKGSAAVSATETLKNPNVQAYLHEILNLSEVTVISEIVAIALAQITDILDIGKNGLTIKPTEQWTARAKSAVKQITVTETFSEKKTTVTTTVVMHDKLNALEKLMKRLRLYPKEMSTLQAVHHLLGQQLLTSGQAEIILNGITGMEEELRVFAIKSEEAEEDV